MTPITIEVTDDQAKLLAAEAERLQMKPQELATRRLLSPWTSPDEEREQIMDYIFEKNAELYRRLA